MIELHLQIVSDNMLTRCRCHGASGSCSTRTCYRQLPSLRSVSSNMKAKYDQSVKVSLQVTKGASATLRATEDNQPAPSNSLVYMKRSTNFCLTQQDYTVNRSCIPQSIKTNIENGIITTDNYPDSSFPACEDLCCSGQYETEIEVVSTSCYCHFVWCCRIHCEICAKNLIRHKCTS